MKGWKCVKYSTVPVHVPSTPLTRTANNYMICISVHPYLFFSTASPVQVQGGLCI